MIILFESNFGLKPDKLYKNIYNHYKKNHHTIQQHKLVKKSS